MADSIPGASSAPAPEHTGGSDQDDHVLHWVKGDVIASGPTGHVYLGMDSSNGRLLAVKQVEIPTGSASDSRRKVDMFHAVEHEIELRDELEHPNVLEYIGSASEDGMFNVFQEYVQNNVGKLLTTGGLDEPLTRDIVRQLLEGLNYLHQQGLIHRNIRGDSIYLTDDKIVKIAGLEYLRKIGDATVKADNDHELTLERSVYWMAPEVVKDSTYSVKSDVWSVGCTVIEMLTGNRPWPDLTPSQALLQIGSPASPLIPQDLGNDINHFIHETFELDHGKRVTVTGLLKHRWL